MVINSRRCVVYGSGIGRSAALILARQHNEYNQIQRVTTFPELAASCRRLLFTEFGPELVDGSESPMPEIPRYNSQGYRAYKRECLMFLVSSQIVSVKGTCNYQQCNMYELIYQYANKCKHEYFCHRAQRWLNKLSRWLYYHLPSTTRCRRHFRCSRMVPSRARRHES